MSFLLSFIYLLFKKIISFPENYKLKKNTQRLEIIKNSLNEITKSINSGNKKKIDLNARRIKKQIGSNFFSTYILSQNAILNSDFVKAKKYMKLLLNEEEGKFIGLKGLSLIALKENSLKEAQYYLEESLKIEPDNLWSLDKLSNLLAQSEKWEKAAKLLESVKSNNNEKVIENRANFLMQSGASPLEVWKLSKNIIPIVIKIIRHYINEDKEKKAYEVLEQTWEKLQYVGLVKEFIYTKKPNTKISLRRFKLVLKALKPSLESNETKLGLAIAAFHASLWGEAKKYLEKIKQEDWDSRIIDLWKKLENSSDRLEIPDMPEIIKTEPQWICKNCDKLTESWCIKCKNCGEIGQVIWSRSKLEKTKKKFLENLFD
ncbi:hypothetical protein OA848_00775 [Rickettsiales bacterium]|nr:hypothetical protein [Rickettsiales bacterium]